MRHLLINVVMMRTFFSLSFKEYMLFCWHSCGDFVQFLNSPVAHIAGLVLGANQIEVRKNWNSFPVIGNESSEDELQTVAYQWPPV
ncbi:unnamed protein product [Gongylonema pulchrum]|uniref:Secreted protein n=1 Tax=Gongylonema pulchrum TaxID=637853 RepID=A0A183DND5_9BILA|nr:unnamed protein product [Gongylonema pulchrum]